MREDWGVELFKLDANYWGTLKGVRYQTGVTGSKLIAWVCKPSPMVQEMVGYSVVMLPCGHH
ncbi:hypothetical protein JCM19233_3035 [Vibrio astriarenae]|nr:hypothetical protein JCM19233_3035 [Vibrio sp. C7]